MDSQLCDSFDGLEVENDFPSLRLSALSKAAQISPHISSTTLGPNSKYFYNEGDKNEKPVDVVVEVSKKISKQKSNSESKTVRSSPITKLDMDDIQYKLLRQNEEKKMKADIRKKLDERCLREIETYENIRRNLQNARAESDLKIKQKREKLDLLISEALKVQEQKHKEYLEERNQEMQERKNHEKENKMKEDLDREQRELDSTFVRFKEAFNNSIKLFVETIQSMSPALKGIIEQKKVSVNKLIIEFKAFSTQADFNWNDMELVEGLCQDLENINEEMIKAKEANEKEAIKQKEAAENHPQVDHQLEVAKQAQQQILQPPTQQTNQENQQPKTQPKTNLSYLQQCHLDNLKKYKQLKLLLDNYTAATTELAADPNLEKLRFNLKQVISKAVNVIKDDITIFQESYDKLCLLLAGEEFRTERGRVSTRDHPQANLYCKMRLAEKILNSEDSRIVFVLADLVIRLWLKFPDFGQIFLARLYTSCPFFVPCYPRKSNKQTDEMYEATLGFRRKNDKIESMELYWSRTGKLAQLVAAIWITKTRNNEPHPFSLNHAWMWLANVMNYEQAPIIYPNLMDEVLKIAGFAMHHCYQKQFLRLISTLKEQFIVQSKKIGMNEAKPAIDRLEMLIDEFISKGTFQKPPYLPLSF
ncbi:unnamed protein product [Diamesa serratosioi]